MDGYWYTNEDGLDQLHNATNHNNVARGAWNQVTFCYEASVDLDSHVCSRSSCVVVSHKDPKVAKMAAARVAGVTLTKEP